MIAIPSRGTIRAELALWLMKYGRAAANTLEVMIGARPEDVARNRIVERFLETDCQKLWMIDDDIVPPLNAAQMLFLDWPLVSGLCYYDRAQEIRPAAFKAISSLEPVEITQPFQIVDAVGAACLIIDRNVFDAIERPWFSWQTNEDGTAAYRSEDIYFCQKCLDKGIKPLLATKFVCLHNKTVTLPLQFDYDNYLLDKEH